KISLPLIFFSFKGDACNNESNPLIGRRFENKFSSFLIFNKPFSGRTLTGILSHLGPPTAPSKIASADLQAAMVPSVKVEPVKSKVVATISNCSKLFCLQLILDILSHTF